MNCEQLTEANQGREQQISRLRKQLMDIRNQLAALPTEITEPVEIITPEPEPKALTHGVEFSILGLATQVKSFVIVVDMSGSMLAVRETDDRFGTGNSQTTG